MEAILFNGMLTKEEFFTLIDAAKKHNPNADEQEISKLVNWAIEKRVGAECVKLLIDGFLELRGWNGDEPQIAPPAELVRQMSEFEAAPTPKFEGNYAQNI